MGNAYFQRHNRNHLLGRSGYGDRRFGGHAVTCEGDVELTGYAGGNVLMGHEPIGQLADTLLQNPIEISAHIRGNLLTGKTDFLHGSQQIG